MPEIDEDGEEESEEVEAVPAAQQVEADPTEATEVEQTREAEASDSAPAVEQPPSVSGRHGEFDRETFAAVLSALKGANAPPAASTAGSGEGDEPFAAPVAADEDRSAEADVPAADGVVAEQAAAADEGRQDVPPVDFGSLIAAMEGMGSSPRPAANPETEPERPPEASLVADDEPFVLRDDAARETAADDAAQIAEVAAPGGGATVEDLAAEEQSEWDGGADNAEPLDLSDLRAPAQGQPPAEPQTPVDVQDADDTSESARGAEEDADSVTRSAGLRARGDDELLRLFQEIETQGQDDGDGALDLAPDPEGIEGGGADEDEDEDRQRITTLTLAEIYAIQGLNQKAIETYRDLLEQDPENDFIRRKLQELENNSGKK